MEGEKNEFKVRISQLESRESAKNQQVEELKTQVEELVKQKESLERQLEVADKKMQDITQFCDQAWKIWEQVHQYQVTLTGEIYKVRLMMARLNVIATKSLDFRKRLLDAEEKVKIQMNWRETN